MPADVSLAARLGLGAALVADERAYRIVRFALAATIATLVGYASGFELPFLVPVLASGFFAKPSPRPSLRTGLGLIVVISGASLLGLVLARLLLPYSYIFLLVAFLVLFRIFYMKAGGGSPLVVVFLLMGITIGPIVALESMELGTAIAKALAAGSVMVIGTVFLTYGLMPDLPEWQAKVAAAAAAAQVPSLSEQARTAMLSTGVVFPVFAAFYMFGMTSSLLILVFIAMLSLVPSFTAGKVAGQAMIKGNLIGGLGSLVFYNMLIVYPSFVFFLPMTFATGLIFGRYIYSGRPSAPLFATGFNTVMLMVGMSVAFEGTEAMAKFYTRIFQIMLAVGYVVAMFWFLELLARKKATP
jgi:hypothetical protein